MSENMLQKVDPEKRRFLKKLAAASVFSLPVVQSFSMNGFSTHTPEATAAPVSPF